MRYLSVCSGIEAASVAWQPLGWQAAAFSEIERFPRAVLKHRFPTVPLHGDFTTIRGDEYGPVQLLVGGTPCQSFSVAGLRKGLADPRGNLALAYLALAERLGARWLVWENVPGVLSSNGGRDFGAFLGGLAELGYGFAYRVLDAQYFGLAQRRRRVFVVAHLGDWRRAAAVLFERHSLSGHPAPRREAGEGVAHTLAARTRGGGGLGTDFDCDGGLVQCIDGQNAAALGDVCGTLQAEGMARQNRGFAVAYTQGAHGGYRHGVGTLRARGGDVGDGSETLIAHTLRGEGFDASEDGTGRGTPLVPVLPFDTTQITNRDNRSNPRAGDPCHPFAAGAHPPAIAFSCKDYGADAGELAPTLRSMGHDGSHANAGGQVAVAVDVYNHAIDGEVAATLARNNGSTAVPAVQSGMAVRRITPTEAERLQGFPDGFTAIPWRGKPASECPDGPRYKALGNSMAVPCMAWIGRRIAAVDALTAEQERAA